MSFLYFVVTDQHSKISETSYNIKKLGL